MVKGKLLIFAGIMSVGIVGLIVFFASQNGSESYWLTLDVLEFLGIVSEYDIANRTENLEKSVVLIRKIAHVAMYFGLSFWLLLTVQFMYHKKVGNRKKFLVSAVLVLIIVVSTIFVDEFIQSNQANRTLTLENIVCDLLGYFLALYVYNILTMITQKEDKSINVTK